MNEPMIEWYTAATIWEVEGARVGIVSCLRCGAAILLDPRDTSDLTALHNQWHTQLDAQ